jgi:hypothetical protein
MGDFPVVGRWRVCVGRGVLLAGRLLLSLGGLRFRLVCGMVRHELEEAVTHEVGAILKRKY